MQVRQDYSGLRGTRPQRGLDAVSQRVVLADMPDSIPKAKGNTCDSTASDAHLCHISQQRNKLNASRRH